MRPWTQSAAEAADAAVDAAVVPNAEAVAAVAEVRLVTEPDAVGNAGDVGTRITSNRIVPSRPLPRGSSNSNRAASSSSSLVAAAANSAARRGHLTPATTRSKGSNSRWGLSTAGAAASTEALRLGARLPLPRPQRLGAASAGTRNTQTCRGRRRAERCPPETEDAFQQTFTQRKSSYHTCVYPDLCV